MKRLALALLSISLISSVIGCSPQKNMTTTESPAVTKDIRQIVYEKLPKDQQELIGEKWKDATVKKEILASNNVIIDSSYIGKEVNSLDFPTNRISIPNNIIVFATLDGKNILGYGLVD